MCVYIIHTYIHVSPQSIFYLIDTLTNYISQPIKNAQKKPEEGSLQSTHVLISFQDTTISINLTGQ